MLTMIVDQQQRVHVTEYGRLGLQLAQQQRVGTSLDSHAKHRKYPPRKRILVLLANNSRCLITVMNITTQVD